MKKKKTDCPVVDVEFEPIPAGEAPAQEDAPEEKDAAREVLCGVVLRRCPVVSYNPFNHILVYERDGQLIQTNALGYHGEGYVEVE